MLVTYFIVKLDVKRSRYLFGVKTKGWMRPRYRYEENRSVRQDVKISVRQHVKKPSSYHSWM